MPNDKLPPCECGSLESMSRIPDMPIKFDPELNEYHFVWKAEGGREAQLMIYHCPFCGGRTPKSRRGNLFASLRHSERDRLIDLFKNLHTVDDVLCEFGQPEWDVPAGEMSIAPEREGKPETTEFYRFLTYTNLSETADVHVSVLPNDRVAISFTGKYLGKSKS